MIPPYLAVPRGRLFLGAAAALFSPAYAAGIDRLADHSALKKQKGKKEEVNEPRALNNELSQGARMKMMNIEQRIKPD
ncbi:hypothetical protein [Paraburkholderia phytofirmans]|uniref:Uncharacterized protein n=1 Tax=Paraburkholderia phytofirmans TaxID=261302 RepID=A0ABW9BP62_9BURK